MRARAPLTTTRRPPPAWALLLFSAATSALWACAGQPSSDLVHIPSLVAPTASLTAPPPSEKATPRPTSTEVLRASAPGRPAGSKIEVEWHGRYYPATVLTTTADGKTRIHYDGYGDEWDEDVGEDRIREPTGAEDPLD